MISTPTSFLDAKIVVDHPTITIDVHLEVNRGEIVGLVGRNGSGKSTVLRAIAGLRPIDNGRITIGSTVIDDPKHDVLVAVPQRRVGIVFQDYRLFPHLSALDNVAFVFACRGVKRRTARASAIEWLERLDVIERRDHKPAELSGGQAQRVALARALATVPDVLLLDEPFAAIDSDSRERIRADLARYLDGFQGATILVSHDHDDICALTKRAVMLENGGVTWQGPIDQLRAREPSGR